MSETSFLITAIIGFSKHFSSFDPAFFCVYLPSFTKFYFKLTPTFNSFFKTLRSQLLFFWLLNYALFAIMMLMNLCLFSKTFSNCISLLAYYHYQSSAFCIRIFGADSIIIMKIPIFFSFSIINCV